MNILIVEDEPLAGIYVETIVKKLGYTVSDVVETADEAISSFQKKKADLIILDVNLKGSLDGIETAHRIKTDTEVPVIYVTAYPDSGTLNRALETNPHAYLIKPFDKRELEVAIRLARQKHRLQSELRYSREQLRRYGVQLQNAQELERKRIAQDIHDAFGQELIGLKMRLDRLKNGISRSGNKDTLDTLVNNMSASVEQMMDNAERIIQQLRPPFLDELGLVESIRQEVERMVGISSMKITFNADEEQYSEDPDVGLALYRVFQEALTNALKHADASELTVTLSQNDGHINFSLQDNGKGFTYNKEAQTKGMGLIGMRERAQSLGGTFSIESGPQAGTTVTVSLPLKQTES